MGKVKADEMSWYGVKLLHKSTVSGKPVQDRMDEFYRDTTEFFEESVLLVKAISFDDAYRIAEAAARENNEDYENKYGQRVITEFFELLDCFRMTGCPESATEVYSTFFAKKRDEDEQALLDERYAGCTIEEMHVLRHA